MSEDNIAADQLRLHIERIERPIVRLRKMQPHDRQEMEAILQTYMAALGME
ncbi:MAG: GapR family DNA-binding domain-containing protein [Sphingobium limneticum]